MLPPAQNASIFVLIYAAGVVNVDGPWDAGTPYGIPTVTTGVQSAGKPVKVGLYVGVGALGAELMCFNTLCKFINGSILIKIYNSTLFCSQNLTPSHP